MWKRLIYIFPVLLCSIKMNASQVGHTTITFIDSSRNNRQIATEIYYPATVAGNDTPIDTGTFPIISFGHGFVMTWSAYQNFWDVLVPEGYILIFPLTETGFAPNHADFGADLKFLISEIKIHGAGTYIPQSSIGTTSAIMGHSMGGGSSFLAAENNTDIITMISFAAANTNPSSITAAQQVVVPTLLFSGANDCVASPPTQQDIIYDSTSAAIKCQIYITGGGHCYFADYNFNCSFGEVTCSPSPTITRTEQQSVANDFLKLWLDFYLKDECDKALTFQDSLSTSQRITFRQSQPISCSTGEFEISSRKNKIILFPDPGTNILTVELSSENIKSIEVFDCLSRLCLEQQFQNKIYKTSIDINTLSSGMYLLQCNGKFNSTFYKQ